MPALAAFGQLNNFKSYSIEEGLPQSNVYCIVQDSRGYLWMGTDGGGLSRFDGLKFVTYNRKKGLAGNHVRALMEDSKGNLWIGTDGGITFYNGLEFRTIDGSDSLSGNTVLSFSEGPNGAVWAGTDDGGVNRIEFVGDSVVIQSLTTTTGLTSNAVFDLWHDDAGSLWLATFGGINVVTPKGESYNYESYRGGYEIPSDLILDLEPDGKGNLWAGTYDKGAFLIELSHGRDSARVVRYGGQYGLGSKSIWSISSTSSGDVWMGTGQNGVARLHPDHEHGDSLAFIFYTEKEGLPNNQILSVLEDREGNVWMGTNGDGLCKFMGDRFAHYSEFDGLGNNKVTGIAQDQVGHFWVATDGGGISVMDISGRQPVFRDFTENEGLTSNFATAISLGQGSNENVWIGLVNEGLVKFNGLEFTNYTRQDGLIFDRVNCLYVDSRGIVWAGTALGISRYDGVQFLNVSMETLMMDDEGIFAITEASNGTLWFATADGIAAYAGDGSITTYDEVEGLEDKYVNTVVEGPGGRVWIGTNGGGLYCLNTQSTDSLPVKQVATDSILSSNSITSLIFWDDRTLIVGTDKGFDRVTLHLDGAIAAVRNYDATDGFTGIECHDNAIMKDTTGNIWFGTGKGLTRYNPALDTGDALAPAVHISDLRLHFKEVDWEEYSGSLAPFFNLPTSLSLPYKDRHLTFYFSGVSLSNPEKVQFQYRLKGLSQDWSPPSAENKVTFSSLSDGDYTFQVRAIDANGRWNEVPAEFQFSIRPPWYRTTTFYVIVVVLIAVGFYLFVTIRERNLQREKKILEETVAERTREVVEQKDEIVKQKEEIEHKNIEITDSINYASKIQGAILPRDEELEKLGRDAFVLYRPKDIVSGDFYWMGFRNNKTLFTAADCTGHGVPGAFMSMIGASFLNESVNDRGVTDPGQVLSDVRAGVIKALKQTGAEGEQKDGMDMALCSLNKDCTILEFAGANNSLYLVRKGDAPLKRTNGEEIAPNLEEGELKMYEVKANKQPVGYYTGDMQPFTTHTLEVMPGDSIYTFSDGYPDQFGGPKGKKFMYKRFKKLLMSINDKMMAEQHELLNQTIEEWMGNTQEQIDDICVLGVMV